MQFHSCIAGAVLVLCACGDDGDGHIVRSCDQATSADGWANVTPNEVSLDGEFDTPAGQNYGVHSFVLDPDDTSILYLGTSAQGIYKSENCGATWTHINTGTNGDKLDAGRQWTMQIDPDNPKNLYTNSGYSPNGSIAWKSTDGGVSWAELISPDYIKALQFGNFVAQITMDPTSPRHLIVTPHFECEVGTVNGLPATKACLLETMDAGGTWRILEGTPESGEGAGQWIVDSQTWYWAAYFGGLFRSSNAGASWDKVMDGYALPAAFSPGNGKWYTGAEFNVIEGSNDGAWAALEDSPGANQVTGDATTLFVSRGASFNSAPVSDLTAWTELETPFEGEDNVLSWGLHYDADHHMLYSLNSTKGFWRLRVD
jgi:hypothetical protein